ncbi:metallophosphoesterase, partial [mine drainage metagenome]
SQPLSVSPSVELVGAAWTHKRPSRSVLSDAIGPLEATGKIRIVVGHGPVDAVLGSLNDEPSTIRLAEVEAAIAGGAIHYVALGDRHSTTRVGESGRVWYAGTPEPTRFDEVDPGNVLIVEVDGHGHCEVEKVRIAQWQFINHEATLTEADDVAALKHFFTQLEDKPRTGVRLVLSGTLTVRDHAALEDLLESERQSLAALEVMRDRSDLVVRPDDFDFESFGLGGFARSALLELQHL